MRNFSVKMDYVPRGSEHESSISEKDRFGPDLLSEPTRAARDTQGYSDRTIFAKIERLAGRLGVEERGIERVLPHERTDTGMSKVGTLWMSANMAVSTFAIGALAGPVFGLGFVDTALTIIFINILGILPVAFFSTFGPRFGLRQMVLSRFYFGYYGVKLAALFNVLSCIGWASVNVIVGAQLLAATNVHYTLPGWAGILILSLSTLLITTFGYKLVHAYERWSWLPVFVIFLIVAGAFGHSGKFSALLPLDSGPSEAGSVLSFAASVYGFAAGWTSLAADYTVYQPETASRRAVFAWVFGGLFIPLIFTQLLGAAVMTAAKADPAYAAAYETIGVGGVLAAVLGPPLGAAGAGFCLVVLALSTVANNCPNMYSLALSLQVLSSKTQRVPRFVWTVLGTCACVGIAVPGYVMFERWLENFMLLVGYWLAIYQGVALTEHFWFRVRGGWGYVVEEYEEPGRLPPGMAAVSAFGLGVVGAILGMAQTWFTGPVGALCGGEKFGGDVGFELAFGFSAVAYLVLRTVERGHYRR